MNRTIPGPHVPADRSGLPATGRVPRHGVVLVRGIATLTGMTIRFTARIAEVAEDPATRSLSVGIAEHETGSGMSLIFQCGSPEPDDQDAKLGMDTYCVTTAGQRTTYGGVTEVRLSGGVLRVVIARDSLRPLGLDDPEIEAMLEIDPAAVERLRSGLARVLAYGRPDAHPAIVQL